MSPRRAPALSLPLSLLLSLVLLPTWALAASLQGTWQNVKTGSLFLVSPAASASIGAVPPGTHVVLRRASSGGAMSILTARPVPGMDGTQITLGKSVGTFSADGTTVRFANGHEWKQTRAAAPGQVPAGWWKSSSGSVFLVTPDHNGGFFVANASALKGKPFVAAAQWVQGMQGVQFRYGTATATVAPDKRTMRVQGKSNHQWTLLAGWDGPARQAAGRGPAAGRRHGHGHGPHGGAPGPAEAGEASIAGTWQMRGGPTLVIPHTDGDRFDIEYHEAGGRAIYKLAAHWSRGMRGNQLRFRHNNGRRYTCTWMENRPHKLQVMFEGGQAAFFHRAGR